MNILFVHNNNDLYGAEVILLELVKRLDKRQFRPLVVLPSDTKHINRLSERLKHENIEYRFINMGVIRRKYFGPIGIVKFFFRVAWGTAFLVWLIRRKRIAIVHSNTLAVVCGALAASISRRPHVWHVHEIVTRPPVARRIMHWLAVHLSETVVAVSGAVKEHLIADCPDLATRICVLHNGIDCDRFARAYSVETIRDEFRVPYAASLVGMIGKVCRWKGQLQFAEAARLVLRKRSGTYFMAVGGVFDDEHHFMERFQAAVQRHSLGGVFIISDFRTDVAEVLGSFDIFVLPSTEPDPFPTVVLEAMAAGKPVIATAHGGPIEMVVDGETGLLVLPGSAEALADAMLQLLATPELAIRMGKAGRERAQRCFHVTRFVRDFENLYATLVGYTDAPIAELASP